MKVRHVDLFPPDSMFEIPVCVGVPQGVARNPQTTHVRDIGVLPRPAHHRVSVTLKQTRLCCEDLILAARLLVIVMRQ